MANIIKEGTLVKKSELKRMIKEELSLINESTSPDEIRKSVISHLDKAIHFATGKKGLSYKLGKDPKMKQHVDAIVKYIQGL